MYKYLKLSKGKTKTYSGEKNSKKIYLDDAQIVDVRKEFIGSKTAPLKITFATAINGAVASRCNGCCRAVASRCEN